MSRRFWRPRPMLVGLAAVGLVTATAAALTAAPASAAPGCQVSYTTNTWDTGFTAQINLTNTGDVMTTWRLTFTFPGNQRVSTNNWSANWTQAAGSNAVSATNLSWNAPLATGASTNFGFNGTYSGTNAPPTDFAVNGTSCNGNPPPTTTSPPPTTTGPPPTTTPPPSTTPPPPGTHVENPYAGAKFYVNPDWSAKAAAEPNGSRIANQSTAVWLDRIAAIAGSSTSMGLQAHLDAALAQQTGTQPVAIEFVIYDLPGRDCAALASNGELTATDLAAYQTRYIDPIASFMSQAKYANLHIVTVIEPDSLPNLVTNVNSPTSTPECGTMQQNGNYVKGVQYALNKLHAIPNVYTYVDAAHSGWLGWSTNFDPAIQLFAQVAQGTTAGVDSIDGFITDTANTTPTTEPFLTSGQMVGGQTINSSNFYQSNPFIDELSYAQAFYTKATAAGFRPGLGMLIDTSRNGWGGPNRPTRASTSTDLNTFVNQSRVDPRPSRGDWCNQSGAGLGFRPVATPAGTSHIDAYVWVKPPGESDGSSTMIPNDQGKGFDRMCDPTYGGNPRNNNSATNALPNSPLSGDWFPFQFQQLMTNAFPPL